MSAHDTPAWPMFTVVAAAPVQTTQVHGAPDSHLRVFESGGRFFASIDGDNCTGPFKTAALAQAYGAKATGAAS
jgi:hypothetical protein